MRLYEYEGKEVFKKYGIIVPKGVVISNVGMVKQAIDEVGLPAVVKAQVLVGGRGKAGGVRIVKSLEEAIEITDRLFKEGVKGVKPRRILIEQAVPIEKELYLSITIDRAKREYIILASTEGGVDIEEIAAKKPEAIVKISVNPLTGLQGYHLRSLSYKLKDLGLSSDVASKMRGLAKNLYQIMLDLDADLVEINPLALIKTGELVALDSKIIIDDNALFKHPDLFESLSEDPRDFTESEIVARKYGFSYVELDGDVGVIANGAGLTMATMDMIAYFGGRPACFLDIGGGANRQRVKEAVKLLLRNPRIKVIMINIYGGITRCDEVAMGIVDAIIETGIRKPLVIRMVGTREEEGIKILREHGMEPYMNDEEAAKRAVAIVRGE